MAFVNWNDSLDIGINDIDRDHRSLAAALNELYELAKRNADNEALRAALHEILRIAEDHFATEERIFREYGYPETEAHVSVHQTLLKQVKDFAERFDTGHIPFNDTILSFIKVWFLTHTTGSDLVYAVWMKQRGFIRAETKELIPYPR